MKHTLPDPETEHATRRKHALKALDWAVEFLRNQDALRAGIMRDSPDYRGVKIGAERGVVSVPHLGRVVCR